MLRFHVRSVVLFLALCGVATGCSFVLYQQSVLHELLLPREQSAFPWTVALAMDSLQGGASTIETNDASSDFDFDFTVTKTVQFQYPYVSFGVNFTEHFRPVALADWTRYDQLKLRIRCDPENVLSLAVHTYDDEITKPDDFGSYRIAETFFSCGEKARDVTIDLTRLETPDWWFRNNGVDYTRRTYRLNKTQGFSVRNSQQSPRDVLSNVKITSASLHGRDWRYIYAAVGLNLMIWGVFAYWYLRRKTAVLIEEITEKIQQERPLIAYQQLPDDTSQDRDRNRVLRYMATHYANQALSVDMAVAEMGINRTKINAILKDEMGLTFNGYVNKLRLTEASRLLLKKEASVAEIAYTVGYNNASYFTTVFKKEYGCTPGDFRKLMVDKTSA